MKKRVNPRRRPATMADVQKAKQDAQDRALKAAWSIFFTVLRDKEGYALEDLQRCWKEVEDLSESIAKGYCTVADLREILELEEGVRLTPRNKTFAGTVRKRPEVARGRRLTTAPAESDSNRLTVRNTRRLCWTAGTGQTLL